MAVMPLPDTSPGVMVWYTELSPKRMELLGLANSSNSSFTFQSRISERILALMPDAFTLML